MSTYERIESSEESWMDNVDSWTIRDSESLYGIKRWGQGLFSVDEDGYLLAHPAGDDRSIRISDLIGETKAPVLIRFHDTLRRQAHRLKRAFAKAIREEEYRGSYFAAFPLKVNPYKEVLRTLFSDWDEHDHPMSFEVGSKPELLIALSLHRGKRFILCNGFKDRGYIDLAIRASKLGKPVFLIVERLSEMKYIVEQSKVHGHMPMLGVRVKLYSYGEGKWASSSGENSKFGLNTMEVMKLCTLLKKEGMSEQLKLLHFHTGSQIPDIRTIKRALVEASQIYCQLSFMGFPMGYMDVGGGLAIDYDGSRTREWSSMNYTMEQYARDVVFNIKEICDHHKVKEPNILSESGRAIAGPHAFLIFEAMSSVSKSLELLHGFVSHSSPRIIRDMQEILDNSASYNRLERLYDARQKREEAFALFNLGYLDLETRAAVESLFWRICMDIHGTLDESKFTPEELWSLDRSLCEQFICNFSIFQSLPDHWALDQRFPIVPLQRLDEEPTVNARIVDITCDSDGEIKDYLGDDEHNQTMLLHKQKEGKPYYIGVAFTGAYQDVLNTSHNLFDRTNEMQVWLDDEDEKGFRAMANNDASSVHDVLRNAQFESAELVDLMNQSLDSFESLDRELRSAFIEEYQRQIKQTTYLEPS
ncbi:MAG: biosynthetic arginine decarboxylase [Puniceicoccaceae bacterium]